MRPVIILALITGVYILALGIIIPILPFQILSLGGSPAQAALVYSVFSGVSVLTLRFWGQMSDRFGRKPILGLSVFITTLSYLWLAYATALWEVYAARALAGAFAAWLPVSQALVSDTISAEKRAPAMGLLGVGFGLGFTIGPALGGFLTSSDAGTYDFGLPYSIAALVSFIAFSSTLLILKETKKQTQKQTQIPQRTEIRNMPLILLLLLYFGVSVMFTGIEGVLAVWGELNLNWQPKDVGYLLMFAGIGSILSQGILIRISTRYLREAKTVLFGIAGLGVSVSFLAAADGILTVGAILFMVAIFMGLHNPAMQSLISLVAPKESRGKVLGIAQAVASFARVIGPIWAGLVLQGYGGNSPFVVAALLAGVLMIFGLFVLRPHFHKP